MIWRFPNRLRNRHLLVSDAIAVILAALCAFAVRFEDLSWLATNWQLVWIYIGLTGPTRLLTFYTAGLYRRLWRQASLGELRQIVLAVTSAGFITAILGLLVIQVVPNSPGRVPFSVVAIDSFLTGAAVALPRLLARTMRGGNNRRRSTADWKRVLLVGAGDAAKLVVKELRSNSHLKLKPIGFVDDDVAKHGHVLMDLPILGSLDSISKHVREQAVAELIIAMPSAPGDVVRKVVRAGLDCGIPTLTVPSLPELLSRKVGKSSLREVEIQDLLRREAIVTDLAAVAELATGETVLVTGAGGSIGSELSRQLARLAPARMILLGHGENSIFDILHELQPAFPGVSFVPIIADVRDQARMLSVLKTYRPYALFHAAAHKHVPLMEENVIEAITNNVLGTRSVVYAAVEAGVERLVFISTDKAVRPTSVMGATKRVAEQIVQYSAIKHDRNFVSVRFGNVLGSRGSVVPTFLRQISAGGPVTVTHPEMQRFFMTIPEAVQLVLQAGALGRGGEVFVLDMGEPIRVVDIAKDLIRLSGLSVGTDIELRFTGIRPGEKLYEEMFFSAENVVPTDHPKVLRARNGMLPEGTRGRIEVLLKAAEMEEPDEELRRILQSLVPDFHPHPTPPGSTSPTFVEESHQKVSPRAS